MSDATSVTPFKYRAFISYSHADKAWGDWLHKALESYRIPAKLVGMPTASAGPVPKRLYPIFRDREELPTSADLGGQITAALAASQFLIVIASPRSAASRWVNEEVLAFKRLGRESRILPIIVDGEPNAAGKPGWDPATDCFCPALKFSLGPDGQLGAAPFEPICADARPQGDGKGNALLKLVAGLLNVGFDALRQRDAEARRRRIVLRSALAGVALAALFGGGTWLALSQRHAAEDRSAALARLSSAALARGDAASAARYALAGGRRAVSGVLTPDTADADHALEAATVALRWRSPALAHKGAVFAAYAPGGERLLTWSHDGVARLWDAGSGAQIGSDMRQDGQLLAAAFTGGGAHIVTATYDGRLALWDAATGAPAGGEVAIGSPAIEAKVSPDGGRILVQIHNDAYDSRRTTGLRLFDGRTLAPVGEPLPHRPEPFTMAFSPDGARILAVVRDPATARLAVLLADAATGADIALLTLPGTAARAIFSSDGTRVIAVDGDGRLGIWDTDGRPIAAGLVAGVPVDRYLGDVVVALDTSPDGKRVMAAGSDGYARFWTLAAGAPVGEPFYLGPFPVSARFAGDDAVLAVLSEGRAMIRPLADPTAPGIVFRTDAGIADAELIAGGTRLLSRPKLEFAAEQGSISLWDAATGDRIGLPIPTAPDAFVAVAKDGRFVAAVERGRQSGSQAVRLWSVEAGAPLPLVATLRKPGYLTGADIAPDGKAILAYGDGVELWDAETGAGGPLVLDDPEAPARAAFSPDGRTVMVIQDTSLRLYDAATGAARGGAIIHTAQIADAHFSPDSARVVTGSQDGTARVIDVASSAIVGAVIQAGEPVKNVWFAGQGRARILTLGRNAQLWDPATGVAVGAPIENLGHRIDADISADGTRLILARPNSDARIWNVETGEELNWPVRHPDKVYQGAFSPDGGTIVTVANDSAARLWNAETASAIGQPMRHREPIKAVTFSADSRRLLTASADGSAQIWDVASATPLGPVLRAPGKGGLVAAGFSAAGDRIMAASEDGEVVIWNAAGLSLSAETATDQACATLTQAGQSALGADELRAAPFLRADNADPCAPRSLWERVFGG